MESVLGTSEQGFPVFQFVRTQARLRDEGTHFHDYSNMRRLLHISSSSSSSSSYICHGVGPLVDQFRSHVSRSLFKVSAMIPSASRGVVFHYPR
jgi:hypothetical protein